jgi:hypothetical protein
MSTERYEKTKGGADNFKTNQIKLHISENKKNRHNLVISKSIEKRTNIISAKRFKIDSTYHHDQHQINNDNGVGSIFGSISSCEDGGVVHGIYNSNSMNEVIIDQEYIYNAFMKAKVRGAMDIKLSLRIKIRL